MNSYTIKNPSDIFSLIMNVYGTLEESMKFISDNTSVINTINSDISNLAGQTVCYDTTLVVTALPPKSVLSTPLPPITEYWWIGREGQNLFDVCMQTYGILDDIINLMNDNGVVWSNNLGQSFDVYGQPFNYDSTHIANSSVWNRTTGANIVFSTGN